MIEKDSNEIILSVENVSTHLGKTWIHRHLNFSIEKGKITAIIGGSGSGKSTLLKEMLGLVRPVSGNIYILGENFLKCSAQKRQHLQHSFGVLFQQGALFSSLNILENIIFPLRQFTRLDQQTMIELAHLKLTLVGLSSEVFYQYPVELSGGMQKRAALARALIMDPKLLFLDEPSSGLDPSSARSQDQLLLELQRSLDLTIVIVTHDITTLENITDHIIFLGEQKVLAEGNYETIKQDSHPIIRNYFHDICIQAWGSN